MTFESRVLPRPLDVDPRVHRVGDGLGRAADAVVQVADGARRGEVRVGDVVARELGEAFRELGVSRVSVESPRTGDKDGENLLRT